MDVNEYRDRFKDQNHSKDGPREADSRAGRALTYALDIRKFEIELYWKRATYFWAFIAAAFAGYGLTHKVSDPDPWLSVLFSALGLVFSFTWYLVNRGSKFWQSNWERHVDLLEDMTLGPLYKVVAVTTDNSGGNPLTSPAQYSVSKLNQVLSVFVVAVWLLLFVRSLLPVSTDLPPDLYKIAVVVLVACAMVLLFWHGKSSSQFDTRGLHERKLEQ